MSSVADEISDLVFLIGEARAQETRARINQDTEEVRLWARLIGEKEARLAALRAEATS